MNIFENNDLRKLIFSFIELPKDGTDDTREYDVYFNKPENKDACAITRSVNGVSLIRSGRSYTGNILRWYRDHNGLIKTKYILSDEQKLKNMKMCITCKKSLPKKSPHWKTECYGCYYKQHLTIDNDCLF